MALMRLRAVNTISAIVIQFSSQVVAMGSCNKLFPLHEIGGDQRVVDSPYHLSCVTKSKEMKKKGNKQ
jgi:hypothetical protein